MTGVNFVSDNREIRMLRSVIVSWYKLNTEDKLFIYVSFVSACHFSTVFWRLFSPVWDQMTVLIVRSCNKYILPRNTFFFFFYNKIPQRQQKSFRVYLNIIGNE